MSHDVGVGAAVASGRRAAARLRLSDYVAPLVVTGTITGTAAAQGGYFTTSWGWTGLALAWALGIAIVVLGGFPALPHLAVAFLATVAALLLWVVVSSAWSLAPWESVLEAERTLIYLLGAAFLLLTARRHIGAMYGGILVAIVLVSSYSLGTRLFPDRIGVVDPIAAYRLAEPIGYWNGLAVFAAMGTLLAVGITAHAARLWSRAGAAAALPILVLTQYFTFSRGGWIALFVGLAAAIALDAHRLRLITVALTLSIPSVAAILVASRQASLTHIGASLPAAAHAGHRLAAVLVGLAAASAAIAVGVALMGRAVRINRSVRLAYSAMLVAAAVATVASVIVVAGSPASIATRAYDSFTAPPPKWVPPELRAGTNLDQRLFNFSGSGRATLWSVAWDDYRAHPSLGSGAGTFERVWMQSPRADFAVHDAHGLYIETLAELGPLGLALVLIVVALPLVAAARARRSSFTAGASGAYVAFFAHAGVDWDWELAGVALTAVCCGALLLALRTPGRQDGARTIGPVACHVALVPLAAFSLVALLGNSALAGSNHALKTHDWPRAEQLARRARSWMPWSPEPWTALGNAQLADGHPGEARASFRRAISHGHNDWEAWLGLAQASTGAVRANALAEARRLNPGVPGH